MVTAGFRRTAKVSRDVIVGVIVSTVISAATGVLLLSLHRPLILHGLRKRALSTLSVMMPAMVSARTLAGTLRTLVGIRLT